MHEMKSWRSILSVVGDIERSLDPQRSYSVLVGYAAVRSIPGLNGSQLIDHLLMPD